MIKSVLVFVYGSENLQETTVPSSDPEADRIYMIIGIGILILFMLIDLALRIYIGISARREAFGRKKGSLYLVLAGIYALVGLGMIAGLIAASCAISIGWPQYVVYVYAAGLAYSGISQFLASFRKTAIVYIQ